MSGWFVLLALSVGAGALLLANRLNRGTIRIERAAQARVRERLAQRVPRPTLDLLRDASLPVDLHSTATALVTRAGLVLGVDPCLLRAEDRLGEILRVDAEELPSIQPDEWRRAGLPMRVTVHSYDLMHLVETFSNRSKWKARWASIPGPPRNEEQWIDRILAMTVGEFLNFFAPLGKTGN
jgi:hypothetical protein